MKTNTLIAGAFDVIPAPIGVSVTICLFALATSCEKPQPSTDPLEEAANVEALKGKVERLKREAELVRTKQLERDRLSSERANPTTDDAILAENKSAVDGKKKAAEEAEQKRLKEISDARAKLIGQTLEKITTNTGDTFEEATIKAITDLEIRFSHKAGLASVKFSDLSGESQEQFHYDPQAFEQAKVEFEKEQLDNRKRMADDRRKANELKAQKDAEMKVEKAAADAEKAYASMAQIQAQLAILESQLEAAKKAAEEARKDHEEARKLGRSSAHLITAKRKDQEAAAIQKKIAILRAKLSELNRATF